MNEPTNSERDRLWSIAQDAATRLSEHFEVMQIFASNLEQGADTTFSVEAGRGNWNARRGQVAEWLIEEDERARAKVRKQVNGEESD